MIVVSGVLVLVALVLLVIGLLGDGLALIWASIITSVVAGVFLLLGALQRRGGHVATAEPATTGPDLLERVTAVSVRPREEAPATVAEPDVEEDEEEEAAPAASGGEVSVVPGRPRYHVAGCRFLAGRPDVETMSLDEARGEGYTACGVCKPDAALESVAPAAEAAEPAKPARKTATKAAKPAAKAAKPAAAAASGGSGSGQVVVIPDRGKYHNETCRFVRDVPGTLTVSKATARRQGYQPCGVCKP